MRSKEIRNSFLLVLTALLWGVSFVAQSEGDAIGPFFYNCIRSLMGSVILLPAIYLLDKVKPSEKKPRNTAERKRLWLGGICGGILLFLASSTQQIGLYLGTSAGKAGFLTTCYILLVPILGLFFGKKCGWNIWIGVGITVVGLYLLCMTDTLQIQVSDGMVLLCAFLFAVHILVIDYFSPQVDGIRMSCIQFLVCGLLCSIPMFGIDMKHSVEGVEQCMSKLQDVKIWIPILYDGILSCGVGDTLQIIGQDGVNPTVASMILSLESVFSVMAGWLILGETMGIRHSIGCILIFVAVILAQYKVSK